MDWKRVTTYWLRSRILWILKCLLEMHKYKAKHFWKNVGISSLLLINYNWWWPMPITTLRSIMDTKVAFFKVPIIFIFDGRSPSRKPLFMSWQRFAFNEINYWALNVFIMTSSQQLDEPVFFKDFFFRKKNISPFLYNNDNEENYTSIFWKIM